MTITVRTEYGFVIDITGFRIQCTDVINTIETTIGI